MDDELQLILAYVPEAGLMSFAEAVQEARVRDAEAAEQLKLDFSCCKVVSFASVSSTPILVAQL